VDLIRKELVFSNNSSKRWWESFEIRSNIIARFNTFNTGFFWNCRFVMPFTFSDMLGTSKVSRGAAIEVRELKMVLGGVMTARLNFPGELTEFTLIFNG